MRASTQKNPIVAAIAGFLLGPFGVALYLQSWSVFYPCFAISFALLLMPVPPLNLAMSCAASAIFGYLCACEE